MGPAGATHYVTATVQAAQVGWSGVQEWPLNLLCICDMDAGINTAAQSFVAGLSADLSDLEVTDAEGTPVPWRRAEDSLFDQTPGAEKLWLRLNMDVSSGANTTVLAWRGCTSPTGEASRADVLAPGTLIYLPCDTDAATNGDRAGRSAGAPRSGGVARGVSHRLEPQVAYRHQR